MIVRLDAERPWQDADPKTFRGSVRMQHLLDGSEIGRRALRVEFQDGGRTNWHTHEGPQLLFVVEGSCRVQRDGEGPVDVAAGGMVAIEPGERHWHGATPGGPGTHIAVNLGEGARTLWEDAVTDEDYGA